MYVFDIKNGIALKITNWFKQTNKLAQTTYALQHIVHIQNRIINANGYFWDVWQVIALILGISCWPQ